MFLVRMHWEMQKLCWNHNLITMKQSGSITLKRHEYICDIFGGTGFDLRNFYINPGNSMLFKFGSQLARNYEQYKFNKLIFYYRSCSTGMSVNTVQVGTITASMCYNSLIPTLTTKAQMLEHADSKSVRISESLLFPIEVSPAKNALGPIMYVTSANSPQALILSNGDPSLNTSLMDDAKTYFMGNFMIAQNNCALLLANKTIGELWVEYDVTFMKPRLFTHLDLGNPYACIKCTLPPVIAGGGGMYGIDTLASSLNGTFTGTVNQLLFASTVTSGKASTWSMQLVNGVRTDGSMAANSTVVGALGGFFSDVNSLTGYRFPDNIQDGYYELQLTIQVPTGINGTTAPEIIYNGGIVSYSVNIIPAGTNSTYGAINMVDNVKHLNYTDAVTTRNFVFGSYCKVTGDAYSVGLDVGTGTCVYFSDKLYLKNGLTNLSSYKVILSIKRVQPFEVDFII